MSWGQSLLKSSRLLNSKTLSAQESWGRSRFRQFLYVNIGSLALIGIMGLLILTLSDWQFETLSVLALMILASFVSIALLLYQLKILTQQISN